MKSSINKKLITIAFIFGAQINAQADILRDYCDKVGGIMLSQWTCPNSKQLRHETFCKQINSENKELVFNGCTVAAGRYSEIFFKACLLHDLCYHNEPNVSGKSKTDCDTVFLNNMNKICDTQSSFGCYSTAKAFHSAVSVGGSNSWNCSKSDAEYPKRLEDLP